MKYPKTSYLPYSPEHADRDERLIDTRAFQDKEVIFYEKCDGENTCLSRNEIHARSLTGYNKKWQHQTKARWELLRNEIPENTYVFAENLYAVHSIEYEPLPDYLFVFNVWMDGAFLSADEVNTWANLLGLRMVPEIFRGAFFEMDIPETGAFGPCEGYVVRNTESFLLDDFSDNVAKSVRKGHVTGEHWTKTWKKAIIEWRDYNNG